MFGPVPDADSVLLYALVDLGAADEDAVCGAAAVEVHPTDRCARLVAFAVPETTPAAATRLLDELVVVTCRDGTALVRLKRPTAWRYSSTASRC